MVKNSIAAAGSSGPRGFFYSLPTVRLWTLALCSIFFVLAFPPVTGAQTIRQPGQGNVIRVDNAPPPSIPSPSANSEIVLAPRSSSTIDQQSNMVTKINILWRNRKKNVDDTPDFDTGPKSMEEIQSLLQENGYCSIRGMESNLVFEAYRLYHQEDVRRAASSLESAMLLNPASIPVHLSLAELTLRSEPFAIGKTLRHLGNAARSSTNSFWLSFTLITNLALLVLVVSGAVAVIFFLILLFRYQKQFRHTVEELWGDRLPPQLTGVAGWAILLAPLLLFFGPFWMFAFWLIVLWGYSTRGERIWASLGLLLLSLLVPALDTVEGTYREVDTSEMRAMSDALHNMVITSERQHLIHQNGAEDGHRGPYHHQITLLLAGIHQKQGDYRQAFDRYSTIPAQNNLYPMAMNNMGNIYFQLNEFDLASEHYRKAIDTRPSYAEAHFNLSSAYFQVYDFVRSDKSLELALRLDPLQIGRLISEGSRGVKVLDYQIPSSFLWDVTLEKLAKNARLHSPWARREMISGQSRNRYARILMVLTALIAPLAGCVLQFFRRNGHGGRLCDSCGQAFCRMCGPENRLQDLCLQCSHLSSRLSGVSPEIKKVKLNQIFRFRICRRVRDFIFSLFLPGAERLRRGCSLSGGFILWCWMMLVGSVTLVPTLFPVIGWHCSIWSWHPISLLAKLLIVIIWLSSVVAFIFRSFSWRHGGS